MYHLRIAEIGLTSEEIAQELSQKPLTKETLADILVRNNQRIAERVNTVISNIINALETERKTHP